MALVTETSKPSLSVRHAQPWPKTIMSREVMTGAGIWSSMGFGIICSTILIMLLNIAAIVLIGSVVLLSDLMGFHAPSDMVSGLDKHMIIPGQVIVWTLIVVAIAISHTGDEHQEIDHKVIKTIRNRVVANGEKMLGHDSDELDHLKNALSDGNLLDSSAGRPLLFRLDAALTSLERTLETLGTSRTARIEASEIAREAFLRILADEDASHAATAPLAIERMRAGLEAIAPSATVDATAPSARIVHIVATAEKGLAIDPDMVDDAGMPVATLVREHIPRFLRNHSVARGTATPHRVNQIDDHLDQCVEAVRLSVAQALRRLGDDAADALLVDLEFLRLRQRVDPGFEETSASPEKTPIRALPDLTPENYVVDFVANGERSTMRLEPWERDYQDAGVIDQAERKGYIHIGRDPRCSIELTEKGRSLVEHG